MTSSQTTQALILICRSLVEEGKKPSVGLLRGKASFKVSVSEAIEAIKHFNTLSTQESQNEVAVSTSSTHTSAPKQMQQRLTQLEDEIKQLHQTNTDLENRIDKLESLVLRNFD